MSIKNGIKKIIKVLVPLGLKPFIIIWFWFLRWFRHNRLLSGLDNKKIGRPSLIYLPLAHFYNLLILIKRIWAIDFVKYALKKYKVFLKTHYSKVGLGYFDYDRLSPDDCWKIYQEQSGRIAYYIIHNQTILGYKDGDSFLDAGCGKGQNIKELVARYPNSSIKGFDVSKEALRVIQIALKDNPKVRVKEGNLVDFQYLGSYSNDAFDHVIVSHAFSFLIGLEIEETRKMRQMLIDHLIRITAKSLLIMDCNILTKNTLPEIFIEQNTRCVFKESLLPYFSKHLSSGELYTMFSPENEAIIFKLNGYKK